MPLINKYQSDLISRAILTNQQQLHNNSLLATYLSLTQPEEKMLLLDHCIRYYMPPLFPLTKQLKSQWQNNQKFLCLQKILAAEYQQFNNDETAFVNQAYTQIIDRYTSKEYYFFVSIRVSTRDNTVISTNLQAELVMLTKNFCEETQCHMAIEFDNDGSLLATLSYICPFFQEKFAMYPDYQFDFFIGRMQGDDEVVHIQGLSQGKQYIYLANGAKVDSIHFNQSGQLIELNANLERGSLIAVIPENLHKTWQDNLGVKIFNSAVIANQFPETIRQIAHQFIPPSIVDLHVEKDTTAEQQLFMNQSKFTLYNALQIHQAHRSGWLRANHEFTISRLLALDAPNLKEYLYYLSSERQAFNHHQHPIAKCLDLTFKFCQERLGIDVHAIAGDFLNQAKEPFKCFKHKILEKLLAFSYSLQNSWPYWWETTQNTFYECPIYGYVAQAATNNFLLDQVYLAQDYQMLQTTIERLEKIRTQGWPKIFKNHLNELNNLLLEPCSMQNLRIL